jgi:hypothetical protein
MALKTAQIAASKSANRCATVSGFSPYTVVGITCRSHDYHAINHAAEMQRFD